MVRNLSSSIIFLVGITWVNFAFADDLDFQLNFIAGKCADTPADIQFCIYARPKDWSPVEKQKIQIIVYKWTSKGLKKFFAKAATNGKIELQRFTSNASQKDGVWTSLRTAEWISQEPDGHFVANVSDAFFESGIDPVSGFDRVETNLIHEISHLFDINSGVLSSKSDFLQTVGWDISQRVPSIHNVPSTKIDAEIREILILVQSNQLNEALLKNRNLDLQYNMPSIYSMASPPETFAELTAYILTDPKVSTYLNTGVISYLKKTLMLDTDARD